MTTMGRLCIEIGTSAQDARCLMRRHVYARRQRRSSSRRPRTLLSIALIPGQVCLQEQANCQETVSMLARHLAVRC